MVNGVFSIYNLYFIIFEIKSVNAFENIFSFIQFDCSTIDKIIIYKVELLSSGSTNKKNLYMY